MSFVSPPPPPPLVEEGNKIVDEEEEEEWGDTIMEEEDRNKIVEEGNKILKNEEENKLWRIKTCPAGCTLMTSVSVLFIEISTIANEIIDVNVFHSTLRFHFKNGVNFIPTILPKFLEFTNLKTLNFKC